jgi:hypothetical protein
LAVRICNRASGGAIIERQPGPMLPIVLAQAEVDVAASATTVDQVIQFSEWFLKTGSVYGLGFVLISALTGLFIYGCWKITVHVIGILATLREWVPKLLSGHWSLIQTCDKAVGCLAESHAEDAVNHVAMKEHLASISLSIETAKDSWSRMVERLEKKSA